MQPSPAARRRMSDVLAPAGHPAPTATTGQRLQEAPMFDEILPHHRDILQRVTEHFQADPRYLALIIGGSVAKRRALPVSDLDIMLLVSSDELAQRGALHTDHFITSDLADLGWRRGGQIEGKLLDWQFLGEAAQRGSEPTRFSFVDAIVDFSRLPDLEAMLRAITTYPVAEQQAKIRSLGGQIANWSGYGQQRQDVFVSSYAAANFALFTGRLFLAYNQLLYPGPKWFMTELSRAPHKPEQLIELLQALLREPSSQTSGAVLDCIIQYRDWGLSIPDIVAAYTEDSERRWRKERPDLVDCSGPLSRLIFAGFNHLSQQSEFTQVIGIVVRQHQDFTPERVFGRVRDRRPQIRIWIFHQRDHALQILAKTGDRLFPIARACHFTFRRPMTLRPRGRHVLRIVHELNDIPSRDAHMLQQSPGRVIRTRQRRIHQLNRKMFDGILKTPMS